MVSNHKPRKGTEAISTHLPLSKTSYVSNHKPRKGTEALRGLLFFVFLWRRFQITNPARGRKLRTTSDSLAGLSCFKSQTPQGDGSHKETNGTYFKRWGFKSQTPQGDGNKNGTSLAVAPDAQFQITNPARGRKLMLMSGGLSMTHTSVSNHKPRKGTETNLNFMPLGETSLFVSNHKPRKGTETRCRRSCYDAAFLRVSNHKPRKGTKKGLHGIVQPLLLVMPGGFVV